VVFSTGHNLEDKLCEDGAFGWQPFVAASDRMKKSYLKTLIRNRLFHMGSGSHESKTAHLVADQLFPDKLPMEYIDHQSVPLIPRAYGTKEPSYEFFKEMSDYILRDGVVIHGGNDNEDENGLPPPSNIGWYNQLPQDKRPEKWVCRREGDWWVLFSQEDGTKVTLSFKDDPEPRTYAYTPELVDLKITDHCPYGCQYCYQGSDHQGEHAEDLYMWLYALRELGVFEVAIGGGEPTLHPKFKSILTSGPTDLQINFSTRNLDWVCHNAGLIRERCGGFAFSVPGNYHTTKEIIETLDRAELKEVVTLQYVMGTALDYEFESLVKLCHEEDVRLTLLGYKLSGRGAAAIEALPETPLQNGNGWIETIEEYSYYMAVDTTLAARVPQNVFDETFLRRTEGTHSMYVDAVTSKAGISSYTDKMIPIDKFKILEAFRSFQKGHDRA
jgi:organic radical activating enzyme